MEFGAVERGTELEANGLSLFVEEEGFGIFKIQGAGELGVVAELGMGIERKMGAVNGEVVFEEEFEELVTLAGPGMGGTPEETVMDDEEIGAGVNGFADGGDGGIDGGGDFGDGAVVLDLESVDRTGVVGKLLSLQSALAMADDGGERSGGGFHGGDLSGWGREVRS